MAYQTTRSGLQRGDPTSVGGRGHAHQGRSLCAVLWNFRHDLFQQHGSGTLKQIFSNASEHSSLIIEYVQRFGEFDGFFTKQNVAELTHAAGVADELLELQAESMAGAAGVQKTSSS